MLEKTETLHYIWTNLTNISRAIFSACGGLPGPTLRTFLVAPSQGRLTRCLISGKARQTLSLEEQKRLEDVGVFLHEDQRKGTWADSEVERLLRAILKYSRQNGSGFTPEVNGHPFLVGQNWKVLSKTVGLSEDALTLRLLGCRHHSQLKIMKARSWPWNSPMCGEEKLRSTLKKFLFVGKIGQ